MDAGVVVRASIVATAVVAAKVAKGIEVPSKRAIEPVRTDEGVSVKPRVPIPAGRVPSTVVAGELAIGFGEVFGAQAAPVIELVLGAVLVLVLHLLWQVIVESKLVVAFDADPLVGFARSGFS